LPIAQRAVEEHGGRVEVDSRSGHGATFTIILPPAAMAPRAAAAVRE
jgi:signal transduction histidine kinase